MENTLIKSMKKIQAVSFDLDHTLYDRNATWEVLCPAFRRTFASCISAGLTAKELCTMLQAADYKATYEETSWYGMYRELVERNILNGSTGFTAFNNFIYASFPDAIVPYDDTYEVLIWCREQGLRPSVITNGHPGLQERKLEAMHLLPYLDVCIICNLDSGVGCKPAPDAFLELSQKLALPPEKILYVGDNPYNDIFGAKGVGMKTAWLNVMKNWRDDIAPADYEISSLSALCKILKE